MGVEHVSLSESVGRIFWDLTRGHYGDKGICQKNQEAILQDLAKEQKQTKKTNENGSLSEKSQRASA